MPHDRLFIDVGRSAARPDTLNTGTMPQDRLENPYRPVFCRRFFIGSAKEQFVA
jgi:hypothetical protein